MRIAYLVFCSNSCYNEVLTEAPKDVSIDSEKGEWTYARDRQFTPCKIGQGRHIQYGSKYGIIGVYDLDDLEQVNTMVRNAVESQRIRHPLACDD
ncbi:MAG: hypothetical protein JWN18_693 [Parcubacteria group bacterium]|nr:hypothetical protein [Parcubacteria group bacterium]